jgi:hypothetical protein
MATDSVQHSGVGRSSVALIGMLVASSIGLTAGVALALLTMAAAFAVR